MKQKPLVLPDIRSRAGAFVAQWRNAEGYERGEAQSFVRDLLRVFGITRSTAAVYEKRAQRASTGGQGYIDALISGTALIEMKSAGGASASAVRVGISTAGGSSLRGRAPAGRRLATGSNATVAKQAGSVLARTAPSPAGSSARGPPALQGVSPRRRQACS